MIEKKNEVEYSGLEIAVIGMDVRFPDAPDYNQFWKNLRVGKESIKFSTQEELESLGLGGQGRGNFVNCQGAILDDKDLFDADFFGYNPKSAEILNPQIRIFHESVWKALEDAACAPSKFDGRIGLFAGAAPSTFWEIVTEISGKLAEIGDFDGGQLNDKDSLTTLVSYKLGLTGPSYTVHTNCSTSLVAIHLACRSLLMGECEIAVAGGVGMAYQTLPGYTHQEGMISSRDGHCRAFDEEASGTVNGEGCGVVVLKPLKKAIRDKDNIHAIIKGSAINNDGNVKVGYTAPSAFGQIAVIRSALNFSKIKPETVTYIETHGTGTKLGDPIEVKALNKTYLTDKRKHIGIGSVKTNLGHLDTAAGVAGFIKLVLSLKNKQLVPSLHFNQPNTEIDFQNSPFYVNTQLKEWKNTEGPLRGAVSSFGIGGTNAHMVLEEAPYRVEYENKAELRHINLSAKTEMALEAMTNNLIEFLESNQSINLDELSYTLQMGRESFYYKKSTLCSTVDEVVNNLRTNENTKTFSSLTDDKKMVFMFPGQGAQYFDMGLALYETNKCFAEIIDKCLGIINKLLKDGTDVYEILFSTRGSQNVVRINETKYTQPLIFSVEYALSMTIMDLGIKPNMIIGHSIGEYVAACISGVFTLHDALKLVVLRGEMMQKMPSGSMLAVEMSEKDIAPIIEDIPVDIAAINGPDRCVVSGETKAIEKFNSELSRKGYKATKLHTSHAFHSRMMRPIVQDFKRLVQTVSRSSPEIPFISNVSGIWITKDQALSVDYWCDHLLNPVRFNDGLELLFQTEKAVFIEVGPGLTLSSLVKPHDNRKNNHQVINLMRHPKEQVNDKTHLLNKIGELWLYGVNLDWEKHYDGLKPNRISLPTYPFQRKRYWIDVDPYQMFADQAETQRLPPKNWFNYASWKQNVLTGVPLEGNVVWIIFENEDLISKQISGLIDTKNNSSIKIRKGKNFEVTSDKEISMDPNDSYQWEMLFNQIKVEEDQYVSIVYSWSLVQSADDNIEPSNGYEDYFNILNLCKSINHLDTNKHILFNVLTNSIFYVLGDENLNRERFILSSAIKTIQQEFPSLHCKLIDLNASTSLSNVTLSNVKAEITSMSNDKLVAIRNSFRWTAQYEKLEIKDDAPSLLKNRGVYLITGGTGKVGMTYAKFLIKTYNATVIIWGRKKLPQKSEWEKTVQSKESRWELIKQFLELDRLEGELIYQQVDVIVEDKVEEAISSIYKQQGKLNGIIHAAAVSNDATSEIPITSITKENCVQQLEPKVKGLLSISKAIENRDPDFVMVTSSLASILGGIGFYGYAGANAMLDAYVSSENNNGNVTRWLSINWDGWSEETGDTLIYEREALEALNSLFRKTGVNQIIVSLTSLSSRVKKWVDMDLSLKEEVKGQETEISKDRPTLMTPFVQASTSIEKRMVELWRGSLGYSEIGVNDDFFELGGDSLKMIHLIAKIQKRFSVAVPIDTFYNKPTIKAIADYLNQAKKSDYKAIPRAEKKEYYRLSSAQKKQFILQEMNKESIGYNETQVFQVHGEIDIEKIESAINQIIKRHEILRSSISMLGDEPVQKILDHSTFNLSQKEVKWADVEENINEAIKPFDLAKPPFLRVFIFRISDKDGLNIMVIDMHHLITDEYAFSNFVNELQLLYSKKKLDDLEIQYKDYSEWQLSGKQQEVQLQQKEYWLDSLKGKLRALDLPYDFMRPKLKTFEGRRVDYSIGAELSEKLLKLCEENKVTLYMSMLSIYSVFLSKLTGEEDIIIGTPTSGRHKLETQSLIGMFVNTLAIRVFPVRSMIFTEYLSHVKQVVLKSFENQDYPYEALVKDLSIIKDPGRNPLFDVWFVLQNVKSEEVEFKGLEFSSYDYEFSTSKWDFTLQVSDNKGEIGLMVEYNKALFKPDTIEKFLGYLHRIIEQVLSNK
ncbi:type I polyketide synthase, partial [Fulvivirga kasyanovii]